MNTFREVITRNTRRLAYVSVSSLMVEERVITHERTDHVMRYVNFTEYKEECIIIVISGLAVLQTASVSR